MYKAIALLISLIFAALPSVNPHARAPQREQALAEEGPLPEALAALVESKQEQIKQGVAGLAESEWAGTYYAQDGPTAGSQLSWTPAEGFVIRWSTCSYGWREKANYGGATFQNGLLKLNPQLSGSGAEVYPLDTDWVAVLWGEQHYLIPSSQLISFCYAAKNVGNAPEIDAFFLKESDRQKRRQGLPGVPQWYRQYLYSKPIVASISQLKPRGQRPVGELVLNVGSADGVVSGMKFYSAFTKNIYMLTEITEVSEHTSTAFIIMSGHKKISGRDVTPRVGWKLSSRAPKDAYMYYPG